MVTAVLFYATFLLFEDNFSLKLYVLYVYSILAVVMRYRENEMTEL